MKSIISLSTAVVFSLASLSSAMVIKTDTPVSAAVVGTEIAGGLASHFPSHIVKLKAANIANITDFESTSFIKNHYATFRNIQTSLQSKNEVMSTITATQFTDDNKELETIHKVDIGHNFKAVVGSFHPSFVSYLTNLDDVEYVEPNQVYRSSILPPVTSPQPYVANNLLQPQKSASQLYSTKQKRGIITQTNVPSWGISRINRRDRNDLTSYTADSSAGGGVHVYIFDSGINTAHPDFNGRAFMEASFIDYEDDTDYAGHGTHVAGTIGGSTFGVAKSTILHGVKILDRNGDGTTTALIQAISHITQIAEPGRSIINLSLTGPRSQTIDDALSMAVREHGIPIFVSAGNSGDNACAYSPSANPDVFTVGASNQNDVVPNFSSHGECVRIYAPGTNITSTWLEDKIQTMDGTSMANPHVTGIAAMLLSEFEFHSPDELYDALVSIATPNILQSANEQGFQNLLAYNGPDHHY